MRKSPLASGLIAWGLLTLLALAYAQDPAAAVLDGPEASTAETVAEDSSAEADAAEPAAEAPADPAEGAQPVEQEAAAAPEADTDVEPAAEEEPAAEVAATSELEAELEETPDDPAKTDWAGLLERAPAFLALTHHAAVHLPIALWLFGAFFVLIGAVIPSWRTQVPLSCLIGGALTSVPAIASGWWYAAHEYGEPWAWGDGFGDWSEHLVKHRWLGFALGVASLGLSVLALVSRARDSRRLGVLWRLGLIALALAVAWEGHLGGELIHGEGFLEEAFEAWVNPGAAE